MSAWRPMAGFDPSKPALVHDELNDKVVSWAAGTYRQHFERNRKID